MTDVGKWLSTTGSDEISLSVHQSLIGTARNWGGPLRNDHGMPSDDLRSSLRRQLRVAVREHDRIAVTAVRDAIAALDNAEAVERGQDAPTQVSEHVAGGVVGLGAAEVERRVLDAESQRSVVRAEIEARLAAATTYEEHGQSVRAAELRLGADALLAVLEGRS